jgi:hypothetical protein
MFCRSRSNIIDSGGSLIIYFVRNEAEKEKRIGSNQQAIGRFILVLRLTRYVRIASLCLSVCWFPVDRWRFSCSSFCLALLERIHQAPLSHLTQTRTAGVSMKAKEKI